MRIVFWSGEALTEFKSALDYMAARNLPAAQKLERRVGDTIMALAARPIGRPGHRPDTYEKRITDTSYVVVYELRDGPIDELRILHLYHMAQDWTQRPGEKEGQ
jgi:toxin ParE1/3/4